MQVNRTSTFFFFSIGQSWPGKCQLTFLSSWDLDLFRFRKYGLESREEAEGSGM